MELKFKQNIMQLGKFICCVASLLFFFIFLASGFQIFIQIGTWGNDYLVISGIFAFVLAFFTLVNFILLVLQFTIKSLKDSRWFGLIIFGFSLTIAIVSFFMILALLIIDPDIYSSSSFQILGWGVSSNVQTGAILTLVVMLLLSFIEYWNIFIRKKEILNNINDDNLTNNSNSENNHFQSGQVLEKNQIISNDNNVSKTSAGVLKLKKIYLPIIFSFIFLFVAFTTLFVVFIADSGYREPIYKLSKLNCHLDLSNEQTVNSIRTADYTLKLRVINNNENEITQEFKVTYMIEDETYEKNFTLTIPKKDYDYYYVELGNYECDFSREVLELYYLDNASNTYLIVPQYNAYTYRFGTIEIAFLSATCISLVSIIISIILFGIQIKKTKQNEQLLIEKTKIN